MNYIPNIISVKGIWNKRSWKGKILSWYTGWVFTYRNIHSLVNLHRKVIEEIWYEQGLSIDYPMIVQSLDVQEGPFRLSSKREMVLDSWTLYLSVTSALTYHANNTRPNIAF